MLPGGERKPDVLVLRNPPERADRWARYCEGDYIKDRWSELVVHITAMLHSVLVGKPERSWSHWGSRRGWRGNIKADAKRSELDGYDIE